jgi:hypothetical protein
MHCTAIADLIKKSKTERAKPIHCKLTCRGVEVVAVVVGEIIGFERVR